MDNNKKLSIKFNILAIISIIIICFSLTPKTLQNDTYYTIKIGELISKNGIDLQDHFSWHEDLPYTYPHWAYDTGMYFIYHLGEISGITDGGMLFIYLSTIILACTLGIVIYLVNNKLSKNKLVSFVLTLLQIYLLKDFIAARAQLVTFILFVLTILFIENFLETKKKIYLFIIPIISVLIANIHCAVWPFFFVLFLPYVAEYLIATVTEKQFMQRFLVFNEKDYQRQLNKKLNKTNDEAKKQKIEEKIKKSKEKQKTEEIKLEKIKVKTALMRENPYKIKVTKNDTTKWLVLVMIICALTGLLTPIKDAPYTYLYKTMKGNTTASISEHLPLTLYNDKNFMITITLFLMILIFTDTKIKLSDLFLLAGLTFLAFMSRRQTSLFIIIAGFVFAKLLTNLIEKYDKVNNERMTKFLTTFCGKIITILIIIIIACYLYSPKKNNKFINSSAYPVNAATWMLENIDIDNMRLYNEYNYGSYLLYRGIPVFIDSRADLYAPEFNGEKNDKGKYVGRDIFSDYINVSTIGTYYATKLDEYDITHVILQKKAKLNMFISRDDNYNQIYSDDNFVIYERK